MAPSNTAANIYYDWSNPRKRGKSTIICSGFVELSSGRFRCRNALSGKFITLFPNHSRRKELMILRSGRFFSLHRQGRAMC